MTRPKKKPAPAPSNPPAQPAQPVYVADDTEPPIADMPPSHHRFVQEYFARGMNATEAAIAAGYAPKNAHVQGHFLLKHPKVRAELDRRMKNYQMGGEEIISRLASQGRGDMADFLDAEGNVDLTLARERGVLHRIKEIRQETGPNGTIKTTVKLYDVQNALVKLGHSVGKLYDNLRVQGVKTLQDALGADDATDPLSPFE